MSVCLSADYTHANSNPLSNVQETRMSAAQPSVMTSSRLRVGFISSVSLMIAGCHSWTLIHSGRTAGLGHNDLRYPQVFGKLCHFNLPCQPIYTVLIVKDLLPNLESLIGI